MSAESTVNLTTLFGGGATSADLGPIPTSVTFAAGSRTATVKIPVVNDTLVETDETLTLGIVADPQHFNLGAQTSAAGTIHSDDRYQLAITPLDAVKAEADAGITAYTFTVSRTGGTTEAVTVDYAVTGDPGLNPTDFGGGSGLPSGTSFTIPAGQTSATLTINVVGDTAIEADENFTVALFNPSTNALLTADASATGTIQNDDAAPTDAIDGLLYFNTLSWETQSPLLYALDGAGHVTLVDVRPTFADQQAYFRFDGDLYLRGSTAETGYELFRIEAGSTVASPIEIIPGAGSSYPQGFAVAGSSAYFTALYDEDGNTGLFRLDSGSDQPTLIDEQVGGSLEMGPALGKTLFYSVQGEGLYRVDSTAATEPELVFANNDCTLFKEFNEEVYFVASDSEGGHSLYKISNHETQSGPVRLNFVGDVQQFVAEFDADLYFKSYVEGRIGLFKIAPGGLTPEQVVISSDPDDIVGGEFTVFNGELYFELYTASVGDWRLNKLSADGTVTAFDMRGGSLLEHNGELFFIGSKPETGFEIYKLLAGSTEPELVADVMPGPGTSFPTQLASFEGDLYFGANMSGTIGPDLGYDLYTLQAGSTTPTLVDIPDIDDLYPLFFL